MSDTLEGREKARFPTLLILGVLMALAIVIVAFVVDSEYGFPVLLLLVICAVAAIGYRVIAGRSGGSSGGGDADSTDGGIPKQESRSDRPLGDTPDAHDEISPHDLPLSNPGRHEAEKMAAGGAEDTTSGHSSGGAAGHGESAEQVGADEAKGGARST